MVDGGFLRPCLDGSWVFTDVQNDGIFRPNRTKSSSTSLVFCACCMFAIFVKIVSQKMAKEKERGIMVFVACEQLDVLVLLFFVAGWNPIV